MNEKTHGLHMSVDGQLERMRFPEDYEDFLTRNGEPVPPDEARAWLLMNKACGRKVIPMSSSCGQPCDNAAYGCKGFDYSGKGCGGYYDTLKSRNAAIGTED